MITVEYNTENADKGQGFVLFTTGQVTISKAEGEWYSIIFNDEHAGHETTVNLEPCVVEALAALLQGNDALAWTTIQPALDRAPEYLDTPF